MPVSFQKHKKLLTYEILSNIEGLSSPLNLIGSYVLIFTLNYVLYYVCAMKSFDGRMANTTAENINKRKVTFPEIVTEAYIDFDKLRTFLGEDINDKFEKYEFK